MLNREFELGNIDEHSVPASGQENSIGVHADLLGIFYQPGPADANLPVIIIPDQIRAPAKDGKIKFEPLGTTEIGDRKSIRLNSSHIPLSRMPSSA